MQDEPEHNHCFLKIMLFFCEKSFDNNYVFEFLIHFLPWLMHLPNKLGQFQSVL